jgi:hypothetical protein
VRQSSKEATLLAFHVQHKKEFEKTCEKFRIIEQRSIAQLRETDWVQFKKKTKSISATGQTAAYFDKLLPVIKGLKFTSDEGVLKELNSVIYTGSLAPYFISLTKFEELISALREKLDLVQIFELIIFELLSMYLDIKISIEVSAIEGLVRYERSKNSEIERPEILDVFKKIKRLKNIDERKTAVRKFSVPNEIRNLIQALQERYELPKNEEDNFFNALSINNLSKLFAIEIAGCIIVLDSRMSQKKKNEALFDFFIQIFDDLPWLSKDDFDEKSDKDDTFYYSYLNDYGKYKSRQVKSLLKR